MALIIKKIKIKNFKGVSDSEIEFNGNARIKGCNGSGKTTVSDSVFWTFADVNTALVKNPSITPIGKPECVSRVDIDLELDGKPLTISKQQKFKTKESDGKTTTSVTNSYEINNVEKSYRDFVNDLKERGIDMDNFLLYTHPSAFTNDTSKSGRENMRAILFKMCKDITDEQIISEMSNVDELKSLLENYRLDEVEQMNKSTIKRINENVGGDNSIINARIDELYSQKSDIDTTILLEQKKNYESEIERIEKALADLTLDNGDKKIKLTELHNKQLSIQKVEEAKLYEIRRELERKIHEFETNKSDIEISLMKVTKDIEIQKDVMSESKIDIEKQRNLYKVEQDRVFDETKLLCPVCGTKFSESKADKIKAEFEREKTSRLETIKSTGDALKEKIEAIQARIESLSANKTNYERLLAEQESLLTDIKNRLASYPESVDLSQNDEYKKLNKEILVLMAELDKPEDSRKQELEEQKDVAMQMLINTNVSLSAVETNSSLDKRIAELKEQRKTAEVEKAKAEKVLDQVTRFKFYKNEKLSESINSHFDNVSFRFFKFLRNGNCEETLEILADGKEINSQANQASQVRAKIGIIKGLSKYFNKIYPVIVDDASLLTQETLSSIKMDNQMIWLCAADGYERLVVEDA